MKRKFYGASLVLLLICLSATRSSAQKRDHLTPEEVELVRSAQILDIRMAVFIKAANRRLLVLTDPNAASSRQVEKDMKKWGELPKGTRAELLGDFSKILEEASTNIDDVGGRDPKNPLIAKALRMLADASTRFLSELKPMRAQYQGAEREVLEQAIENAQLIVEAADRLPPEK
jgi:hypothetical protein